MDIRIESAAAPFEGRSLELRLLGPFELIYRPSGDRVSIPSIRMRALIAYLAAAPRCTETRRALARLLWAGKGDDLARQSLRQLLSQFRRGADPDVAGLVNGDEVALMLDCASITIDRSTLLNVPADADIETLVSVVNLYHGDFAAGLEIDEGEFDDWLEIERARCRDMAIRLLDRLVRALIDVGRHEEALEYANRLAKINPMREETHRLVIAQEAAVSGRASAMTRFEHFRLLLKDELGVRPEAATLQMLEVLRQQQSANAAPAEATEPAMESLDAGPSSVTPVAVALPAAPIREVGRWRRITFAAGLAIVALLISFTVQKAPFTFVEPVAHIDENAERASVLILPFKVRTGLDGLPIQANLYETATELIFAHNPRLSVAKWPAKPIVDEPFEFARAHHIQYLIATDITTTSDGPRADTILYESATGTRIFMAPTLLSGEPSKFARSFYESIYPAVLLYHAHELAVRDPYAISTLLWQAAVEQARTGSRAADPPQIAKFEAVLAKDPENLEALLGLSSALIQRVARDLSKGLNRMDDLYRAAWRLEQAKRLAQAKQQPTTMGEVAFLEGMLDKLESKFPEAAENFKKALTYTPDDGTAAAELAHVTMFMGQLQEAYVKMEAIPNFDAADSAFLAGETALMAGHPDRALFYYDEAISASPTIPRNYAWRSVALWRLHRESEAHESALKSQEMAVAYLPYWMAARAQYADKRYRDARDVCVKDFERALTYKTSN